MQFLRVTTSSCTAGTSARCSAKPIRTPFRTVRAVRRRNLSCASKNSSSNDDHRKQPTSAETKEDANDGDMREQAGRELGPLLQSLGIDAEPAAFLDEVMTLAALLQLGTCGMTYWFLQLYCDWSTIEAFRAAIGLAVGLVTRPPLETELLFLPLYSDLMQIISPNSVIEVGTASKEQVAGVLNTVGALLFVAFLVPQMLFGWSTAESTQLVVPMAAGWLLFDLAYMLAFLLKLRLI